jgi:hypothetical protein
LLLPVTQTGSEDDSPRSPVTRTTTLLSSPVLSEPTLPCHASTPCKSSAFFCLALILTPSPYTDVKSFISLATLIENVGVSAYAGAAQYISDPAYVTIAATILTTEARHQAWQSSAVSNAQPWSSAYDTALGLDMVYTIASAFITSCPESNPALPVKAFGALTVENGNPGETATFTFDNSAQGDAVEYAIFYNGVGTAAVQLDANHMAQVPAGLQGISYVVVSTAAAAADVTPDNIVAGPAFIVKNFDAWTANPSFMG